MTPRQDTRPPRPRTTGHWSEYAPGTGWGYRYRVCLVCGKIWRNNEPALIRKGRKP